MNLFYIILIFALYFFQGHKRLVNAIAALYGKHQGREIDPLSEVLVSVGAYGSLFYTMMGLIGPGDEVS